MKGCLNNIKKREKLLKFVCEVHKKFSGYEITFENRFAK